MEDNFYKDEFEVFLQEQANNHKMFPSDNVWRNIHNSLHEDKTWPALTIASFAILAAIIAVSVYFAPKPNIFADQRRQVKQQATTTTSPLITSLSSNSHPTGAWHYTTPEKRTELQVPAKKLARTVATGEVTPVRLAGNNLISSVSYQATISEETFDNALQKTLARFRNGHVAEEGNMDQSAGLNSTFVKIEDQKLLPISAEEVELHENAAVDQSIVKKAVKKKSLKNRFSYQVYITPSRSFRNLRENKLTAPGNNAPVAINYIADVNNVVRHTPGTGLEAGIALGYDLGKKLKLTGGLQFNARQYIIEAYQAHAEVATIDLQGSNGIQTIRRHSQYRTSAGSTAVQLANRYYQVSVPVGLAYEVFGSDKVSLNVAASIQPTYLLTNNSYLISTNFKNYTESTGILRKWNINSNVEVFFR